MLRITGGSARGRSIKLPPGDVRPAMARARISLFDYLADLVNASRVIDLYCGSGSLGFEALSRGASTIEFVDNSAKVLKITKDNADHLGFGDQSNFIRSDVFQYISNFNAAYHEEFDIAFASPPYSISEPDKIMEQLHESQMLRIGGSLCVEYPRFNQAAAAAHFKLDRQKRYGTTVLEVWSYAP